MLSIVAPQCSTRLERLTDAFAPALQRARERTPVTIHGDLYEAQLVVDGADFSGLLDVDGAGPGDPYADPATVLAHLRFRAGADPDRGEAVGGYADELRTGFVEVLDPDELDLVTAAALVGLATGPFRIQQRGWIREVERHLAAAEELARTADERSLSRPSRASHAEMRELTTTGERPDQGDER
jgi:aminoglycoside phosphotransferase (APT) family kinase protein